MVENVIGDVKIVLPQVLDISMVHTLHKDLTLHCENRNSFRLDAGAVKKITSPAIQLIVSFLNHVAKICGQLEVDNLSPEVEETLGDFGLLELIQKWGKET